MTRDGDQLIVDNGLLRLTFCTATKALTTIENLAPRTTTALKLTWGWYNSSVGGCTEDIAGPPATEGKCSGQKSGAYIFRPNSSTVFYPGKARKPTLEVVQGDVVMLTMFDIMFQMFKRT